MTEELWNVRSHVIAASHIRGFQRGVRNERLDHLWLAIKQYSPKNQSADVEHAITIIAVPGVSQAKELYEPFFNFLLSSSSFPVRAIWSFDTVHHGDSYVLNESVIGDEHHWFDPARDLLQLVNHFQNEIIPPVYGLGQSWGCVATTMSSIFHPRLFSGLISIEPVFGSGARLNSWARASDENPSRRRALGILRRRDVWRSRKEARGHFASLPSYRDYDPEVLDLVLKYDLRECPTSDEPGCVKLKTPTSMQIATMLLPDPPLPGHQPGPEYREDENEPSLPGFYRNEPEQIRRSLPFVYPPVLYVWGNRSLIGMSDYGFETVARTGTGRGGGGGTARYEVTSHCVPDAGHNVVLEKPKAVAAIVSDWIRHGHIAWQTHQERIQSTQAPFEPEKLHPYFLEKISKL